MHLSKSSLYLSPYGSSFGSQFLLVYDRTTLYGRRNIYIFFSQLTLTLELAVDLK